MDDAIFSERQRISVRLGNFYENFSKTLDEEVRELLRPRRHTGGLQVKVIPNNRCSNRKTMEFHVCPSKVEKSPLGSHPS